MFALATLAWNAPLSRPRQAWSVHATPPRRLVGTCMSMLPSDHTQPNQGLEQLYRKSARSAGDDGGTRPVEPGTLSDLPLFRVPWTALPGVVQVLQVSGPEWVHMFEELVADAQAEGRGHARFGHIARTGNSTSIALRAFEWLPGSKGALIGTLMEVREIRRLPRGRLLVVAHAMSRLRVIRPTHNQAPYPRADVALLPDDEELGLTGLRREAGLPTSRLPRHWRAEAARAAAAAASLTWAEAEIDMRSFLGVVEPGTPADPARPASERRADASGEERASRSTDDSATADEGAGVTKKPRERRLVRPPRQEMLGLMRMMAKTEGVDLGSKRALEDIAIINPRLSVRSSAEQAARAGSKAAEAAIDFAADASRQGRPVDSTKADSAKTGRAQGGEEEEEEFDGLSLYLEHLGVPVLDGFRVDASEQQPPQEQGRGAFVQDAAASDGIGTAADEASAGVFRSGEVALRQSEAAAAAAADYPQSVRIEMPSAAFDHSPPFLLALEQAIWSELVQCVRLANRRRALQGDNSTVMLPEQLLALIPPPPAHGWPAGMPEPPASAEWLRRWGYPPVRRAQRLSFLIAAGLPAVLGEIADPTSLGRQALLQKSSVRERLQATIMYLAHYRQKLAAMISLSELGEFNA